MKRDDDDDRFTSPLRLEGNEIKLIYVNITNICKYNQPIRYFE